MDSVRFIAYRKPGMRCKTHLGHSISVVTKMHQNLLEGKFYERRTGIKPRRFLQEFIGLVHIMYDHSTATDYKWKVAADRVEKKKGYLFSFSTENF